MLFAVASSNHLEMKIWTVFKQDHFLPLPTHMVLSDCSQRQSYKKRSFSLREQLEELPLQEGKVHNELFWQFEEKWEAGQVFGLSWLGQEPLTIWLCIPCVQPPIRDRWFDICTPTAKLPGAPADSSWGDFSGRGYFMLCLWYGSPFEWNNPSSGQEIPTHKMGKRMHSSVEKERGKYFVTFLPDHKKTSLHLNPNKIEPLELKV